MNICGLRAMSDNKRMTLISTFTWEKSSVLSLNSIPLPNIALRYIHLSLAILSLQSWILPNAKLSDFRVNFVKGLQKNAEEISKTFTDLTVVLTVSSSPCKYGKIFWASKTPITVNAECNLHVVGNMHSYEYKSRERAKAFVCNIMKTWEAGVIRDLFNSFWHTHAFW